MALKRKKLSRIAPVADIPEDSFSSSPMLEICGGEVFVSGCSSLTEYGENRISFSSSLGTVSVSGERLSVTSLEGGRMVINGTVRAIKMGESND